MHKGNFRLCRLLVYTSGSAAWGLDRVNRVNRVYQISLEDSSTAMA